MLSLGQFLEGKVPVVKGGNFSDRIDSSVVLDYLIEGIAGGCETRVIDHDAISLIGSS